MQQQSIDRDLLKENNLHSDIDDEDPDTDHDGAMMAGVDVMRAESIIPDSLIK